MQIVTKEDLMEFKQDLISEIEKLFKLFGHRGMKKWLKSNDVCEILQLSVGTLQNLRSNGMLPFTKVGGVIYYEYEDIRKMLDQNKSKNN